MTTTASAPVSFSFTASYLARTLGRGQVLTSASALEIADAVAHGDLGAINAVSSLGKRVGDNRLVRLASVMANASWRGAFDPLSPMGSEAWAMVEEAGLQVEADEVVRSTWETEEVGA
jgi:hypothetical protein